MSEIYFLSGIGTDVGKSYAAGHLAKKLTLQGKSVITQKFIQTGNRGMSEDILLHRRITGTGLSEEDRSGVTAPVILSYPASPQLAARIDSREIDLEKIGRCTDLLASKYEVVIIEGAGGLMVPITDDFLTIDYPRQKRLPVILVTNGALGSINHTLLSLEALKARRMRLHSLLYNCHFDVDKRIAEDTKGFLRRYLNRNFPGTEMLFVPEIIV